MMRKVYKKGGSLIVTLPIKYLREFGWKAGDFLNVSYDVVSQGLLYKKRLS